MLSSEGVDADCFGAAGVTGVCAVLGVCRLLLLFVLAGAETLWTVLSLCSVTSSSLTVCSIAVELSVCGVSGTVAAGLESG